MVEIVNKFNWKVFFTRHRALVMTGSILFAAILIFAGLYEFCGDIGNRLAGGLPANMATSPVAQNLIESKLAGDGQNEALPSTGELARQPKEAAQEPAVAAPAVVANASKAILAAESAITSTKEDLVVVSKIEVAAPIVVSNTTDNAKLHSLLDLGAVFYPGSVTFGQTGQTILLGHSAPANWPKIKHDTIFSRLIELGPGDEVIVTYAGKTYYYSVNKTKIIEKGGDVPQTKADDNSLVLVSCWPPGRDLKRIAVEASLVKTE